MNQDLVFSAPRSSASCFSASWEPLPQPTVGCTYMQEEQRWSPFPSQAAAKLLPGKQSGGDICVSTEGLTVLPLAIMAPVVNNLLLSNKKQNHWSIDQTTVYAAIKGPIYLLRFNVCLSLVRCPVLDMSYCVLFSHSFLFPVYLFFTCVLPLCTSFQQCNCVWHPLDNLVLNMLQLAKSGFLIQSSEEYSNNSSPLTKYWHHLFFFPYFSLFFSFKYSSSA